MLPRLFAVMASGPLPCAQNPRNFGSERPWEVPVVPVFLRRGAHALTVRSMDQQQQQQHLGTGWTCRFSGPSPDLLSQKLWSGAQKSVS